MDEDETEGVMSAGLSNGHHRQKPSDEPLAMGASTAEKAGVILVSSSSHYSQSLNPVNQLHFAQGIHNIFIVVGIRRSE